MRDAGHQTPDGGKSKNNISTPKGVDIIIKPQEQIYNNNSELRILRM